jgi:hypothetical protein
VANKLKPFTVFVAGVCVCVFWGSSAGMDLPIRHCLFILQSTYCIPITSADIVSSENIILGLTFIVRHLNAIKSTPAGVFLGILPLPALQPM